MQSPQEQSTPRPPEQVKIRRRSLLRMMLLPTLLGPLGMMQLAQAIEQFLPLLNEWAPAAAVPEDESIHPINGENIVPDKNLDVIPNPIIVFLNHNTPPTCDTLLQIFATYMHKIMQLEYISTREKTGVIASETLTGIHGSGDETTLASQNQQNNTTAETTFNEVGFRYALSKLEADSVHTLAYKAVSRYTPVTLAIPLDQILQNKLHENGGNVSNVQMTMNVRKTVRMSYTFGSDGFTTEFEVLVQYDFIPKEIGRAISLAGDFTFDVRTGKPSNVQVFSTTPLGRQDQAFNQTVTNSLFIQTDRAWARRGNSLTHPA